MRGKKNLQRKHRQQGRRKTDKTAIHRQRGYKQFQVALERAQALHGWTGAMEEEQVLSSWNVIIGSALLRRHAILISRKCLLKENKKGVILQIWGAPLILSSNSCIQGKYINTGRCLPNAERARKQSTYSVQ